MKNVNKNSITKKNIIINVQTSNVVILFIWFNKKKKITFITRTRDEWWKRNGRLVVGFYLFLFRENPIKKAKASVNGQSNTLDEKLLQNV